MFTEQSEVGGNGSSQSENRNRHEALALASQVPVGFYVE